jgi:Rps23 Pro-64 3,4-dihydroxylase Tpa1-like proline 4-hydroxylase
VYQFDSDLLDQRVASVAVQFQSASPFRHFVIDDFVDADTIATINDEFADVAARRERWQQFESGAEIKFALADVTEMGPTTAAVLSAFNSQPFVGFIEQVTGIDGIITDPGFVGGGMHEIASGGFLKIHADFNRHKHLRLDRRLNVILYLNADWDESWGGNLELWDRPMSKAEVSLAPQAGRLVCFATDDYSYHGHPDPIACPPDRYRRSLALYYYTNGRPATEVTGEHTTLFRERPGEHIPRTLSDVVARLRAVKRSVLGAASGRR